MVLGGFVFWTVSLLVHVACGVLDFAALFSFSLPVWNICVDSSACLLAYVS